MVKVGQVALKIAGRDAGELAVVVSILDKNHVLVDGNVRRRKCNLSHLEFLGKEVKVKEGANTNDVRKSLKDTGFSVEDLKKDNKKEKKERPKKLRKKKGENVEVKNKK